MATLADAALACILSSSIRQQANADGLGPADWGKMMCVNRGLQQQLLRVLVTTPVHITVDCSIRSWRSLLQAAGAWCSSTASLVLQRGSARSLTSLAPLLPFLQPNLAHLTLQGLILDQEGCHMRDLVGLLLQHCPLLEHLDLQDCDLPHLGNFYRLLHQPAAPAVQEQPQHSHTQHHNHSHEVQPQQQQQQPGISSPRALKALVLTGARIAQGPSHAGFGTQADKSLHQHQLQPATKHAVKHPRRTAASILQTGSSSSSSSSRNAGVAQLGNRLIRSTEPSNTTAATVAATATAATCKAQEAAAAAGGSTSGAQQVSGVEELHLGCGCDHVDTAWLHSSSAVTSSHIIGLLQGACQALRVLDVSKRPAVNDDLLLHLAAHPPHDLHTLDVSLTRVTPGGLLQLLQHCRSVAVLRYACRSGDTGLDVQYMQALAAVLPAVQEVDLSLHPHLDDAGLAALAQCRTLRKVKLARSHKVTNSGIRSLVTSLPLLEELTVVRCRGVGQACLTELRRQYPELCICS